MRCPKCSFISFDVVEKCVKCGKKISAAADELHGMATSNAPPVFLRFDFSEPEPEAASEGGAEAFDLGGGEEGVFDLGGDEAPSLEVGGLDLGIGEAAAEPAPDLSGSAAAVAEESAAPSFEISDLAPAQEEAAPAGVAAEELEFAGASAPPPQAARSGSGLADLRVEGIDLEASPGAGKGKIMPSVKTGTALDDFDVDLGELIPKKKQ